MTSKIIPQMKISGFKSILNKLKKPIIVRKDPISSKTEHMIFSKLSRKSDMLSLIFYCYFTSNISIPLNTLFSVSQICLASTSLRIRVKNLACENSFSSHTFVKLKEKLDHSISQVILFFGVFI